jgi:hypothetical protein
MSYVQIRHRLTYGQFTPIALHDIVVHDASIGIPGITKMYEATPTNYGLLPVLVERCNYLSDTSALGAMVAYNIERWDPANHTWARVVEFAKATFCTPVPLSMESSHWVRSWLWPGQSLSTEEEATGARWPFKKGDALRLVVVANVAGSDKRSSSYPTPSFTLDEQMLDDETPFRVRH